MAKIAKPKKREPSLHSRASRRNATPPVELAVPKGKTSGDENEQWLHTAQNAGVHKKPKAKKPTRQQRLRQVKALERADSNSNKLEQKVAESKQKGRKIQGRRKDWDELNHVVIEKDVKPSKGFSSLQDVVAMQGIEEEPQDHAVEEVEEVHGGTIKAKDDHAHAVPGLETETPVQSTSDQQEDLPDVT